MNRSTNECLKSLIKPEAIHHAAIGLSGTSRQDFVDRLVVREDSPLCYCPAADDRLPARERSPGNLIDGASLARG
jgi:hypothetical protein